jgi:cellulase (glycosyl hydrolase family 5)
VRRERPLRPLPRGGPRLTRAGLPTALLVEAPGRRRVPLLVRLAAAAALALAPAREAQGAPVASLPATTTPITHANAEVNRPLELRVSEDAARGAVLVRAELTAPSGVTIRVPGFPLERGFAVRVRPREPGAHRYRILAEDGAGGAREVAAGRFRADDRGASGQIELLGDRLATEEGRTFRPLGENRFNLYDPSWSDGLTPDAYLARMARDGMNTLRLFVFTACGRPGGPRKPGCLEPALGRFDAGAAAQYDAIFAAAERHGVKVVLAVFAVGFTPGDAWKGWEENPYSVDRGGPADAPNDFFSDPAAREAARRRLRYVLARWSASPALLAVDLLNEPEWDGGIDERRWIPWAEDLARTWRAEDPYGHPVTAGPVGLHWNVVRDERPWWESERCDVVQWHRYGPDVYEPHALARELVATVRDTRRYGKPVLVGEFGYGGEPRPAWDHTHVGIWAATFAGAGVLSHSAPVFNVDSDAPMTPERARNFRTLAAFLARAEAREPLAPAPDPRTSTPGLRALCLAGERARAIWLHAPRAGYGRPVRGARVTLADVPRGRWRVAWFDDVTGAELGGETRELGGDVVLVAPPFRRHVAGLLERLD